MKFTGLTLTVFLLILMPFSGCIGFEDEVIENSNEEEIIESNITGWLVEPGDPELLADKIIHVLDLPQNKKDLVGKNARKRVVEKFSLQQMLSKTLSVYEELIEKHKKNSDN